MSKNYVIRSSTFETNSSSAHTFIVVNTKDSVTQKELDNYAENHTTVKNGNKYLRVSTDSFDQEFRVLNSWDDKLRYILAIYQYDIEEVFDTIIPMVLKHFPGYKGIALEYCDSSIDNLMDASAYEDDTYDPIISLGRVDHQSTDNVDNMISALRKIKKYKSMSLADILEDIIFMNKFNIVVEGDGNLEFETLYSAGFFIDKVKYILKSTYKDNTFIYDLIDDFKDENRAWYNVEDKENIKEMTNEEQK